MVGENMNYPPFLTFTVVKKLRARRLSEYHINPRHSQAISYVTNTYETPMKVYCDTMAIFNSYIQHDWQDKHGSIIIGRWNNCSVHLMKQQVATSGFFYLQ